MVVWEDRGVLKPPKPPTVHATGSLIKRKQWTDEQMLAAINSVQADHMSGNKAADLHGCTTLHIERQTKRTSATWN